MLWQDIVITICIIVFSIALVPQVYHGYKHKVGSITISTSLPTFLSLYTLAGVYLTLRLYFSAFMSVVTGTLWLMLFVQRLLYYKF